MMTLLICHSWKVETVKSALLEKKLDNDCNIKNNDYKRNVQYLTIYLQ